MYVRKFEADSLEEALKEIKRELGPDAIILKTLTNKGLKGVFNKKKIEITAAISEKNYSKKAKVDNILTTDQQDKFYQNKSSYISNMLNNSTDKSQPTPPPAPQGGYGALGLNKSALSATNDNKAVQHSGGVSLDDFLSAPPKERSESDIIFDESEDDFTAQIETSREVLTPVLTQPAQREDTGEFEHVVNLQRIKIDDLEKKIYELGKSVAGLNKPEALGVQELVSILRSLDIEERYVQKIIRKANFELSVDDKENPDVVIEFALREMLDEIAVAMPLFSSIDNSTKKSVTVVISDMTCGQSTMMRKIASLQKDAVIIRNKGNQDFKDNKTFSEKFFNIETEVCSTISEIVSATRSSLEKDKNIFIDYKAGNQEVNEVKKFIDGLKRSFENVEVLITLSSINSELYNRRVLNRYARLANGMVVTHLDQCLNFGSLFNLAIDFDTLPYKFFGTGEVVPDDLEAATAERILAGIFQL